MNPLIAITEPISAFLLLTSVASIDTKRALGNRLSDGSMERPGREITGELMRHGEAAPSGWLPDGPDG